MNPFLPILRAKGFTEGACGRFLAPDYKQGNNLMVELDGDAAIITGNDLWVRAVFPDAPQALDEFRKFLA